MVMLKIAKPAKDLRAPGSKVAHDAQRNCLTCLMFSVCQDPEKKRKPHAYRCSKWHELPVLKAAKSFESAMVFDHEAPPRIPILLPGGKKDHPSIIDMVAEALKANLPVPPDFTSGVRDLPRAKNFWQWADGEDFCNTRESGIRLFPKQFEVCMNMLGEACPRCSDPKFYPVVPFDVDIEEVLDHVTLMEDGVCPSCKARKHDLIASGEIIDYLTMAGIAGQRSGKNITAAILETYNIHRWQTIPSPHRLFGLPPFQLLTGTYSSVTFDQAKENVFEPIRNLVNEAPWFGQYHELLDAKANDLGDEPLYKIADTFIRYRLSKTFYGISSANQRTTRGRSRISVIADETGWWYHGNDDTKSTRERANATEYYIAVKRSMLTVTSAYRRLMEKGYDSVPKPVIVTISSPSAVNDFIMTMNRAALKRPKGEVYTWKIPTWEFNPYMRKDVELKEEFDTDPTKAWRDYGCEPPHSSAGWIVEKANAVTVFDGKPNVIKATQLALRGKKDGRLRTSAKVTFRKTFNGGRVLCLDAGQTSNSFGLCVAHIDEDTGHMVVDGLMEVQPRPGAPISLRSVYDNVIVPIVENLGIRVVVADHWQSKKMLEDLATDFELSCFEHRLKYEHMSAYRQDIYDKKVVLPVLEMDADKALASDWPEKSYPSIFLGSPAAHLLYQMMSVVDIPNRAVEKGSGMTDDIFRASALAHWAVNNEETASILDEPVADAPPPRSSVIGITGSSSGVGAPAGSADFRSPIGVVSGRAGFGMGDSVGSVTASRSGGSVFGVSGSSG